jgi:hypothetical protein
VPARLHEGLQVKTVSTGMSGASRDALTECYIGFVSVQLMTSETCALAAEPLKTLSTSTDIVCAAEGGVIPAIGDVESDQVDPQHSAETALSHHTRLSRGGFTSA